MNSNFEVHLNDAVRNLILNARCDIQDQLTFLKALS